ncbi:MAG: DNA mismatch repair endonuclease MutL [Firmicutes bacterium]|nr:DNA mismatch repair endonuclease MutL [Bacillota bacterium]
MDRRPITVLDPHVANQIAAGEVIERPASVVKELVENALDAGARRIEVEIRGGGKEYIRVSDDGAGIPPDEVPLAFCRHATSKIVTAADLSAVSTLGFRGEALASIAAVAEVEMRTRTPEQLEGTLYEIAAGKPKGRSPVGAPPGTTVIVRRLFFNTPARYKFLRSDAAEKRHVADVVARLSLARPEVAFRLVADGREVLVAPGDGLLASAVAAIFGPQSAREMLAVQFEMNGLSVSGLVGKPALHYGNRDRMCVVLNGRFIHSPSVIRAIEKGYDTLLPPRRFPAAVIHLECDPAAVDVNVHPAKAEVRFRADDTVFRAVHRAVRRALLSANLVPGHSTLDDTPPRPHPSEKGVAPAPLPYPRAQSPGEGRTPASEPAGKSESAQGEWTVVRAAATGKTAVFREESAVRELAPSWGADGSFEAGRTGSGTRAAPGVGAGEESGGREILRRMEILGQLHRTFILGETPGGLWIVDQHVAHERVLYERILRDGGPHAVQRLLAPVSVTLPPARSGLAEQYRDKLEEMGFLLEPFGGTSYLVRGLPVALSSPDPSRIGQLLDEVLSACEAEGRWNPHRLAAAVACRSAIKAGQVLDRTRMAKLVAELSECENPFACPHGRPIIIEVGRADLERRFGRH